MEDGGEIVRSSILHLPSSINPQPLLYRPLFHPVRLFPEHELVAAAQVKMFGHAFFLATARHTCQFIHKLNLLPYRFPKLFGGINLDPLAVNLRLAWPVSIQAPSHCAINPVTGKHRGDELT